MALLLELEQAVRNPEGVLTSQEANYFIQLRSKIIRDFTLGLTGGAVVTWFASRRLPNLIRLNLTTGIGFLSGVWRFSKASDNVIEDILSLEGTRLQKEMGTLMLRRYQDDPLIMQRVSKYFYSEDVYNDASDQPRLRWRHRNFFADSYSETSDQKSTGPETFQTPDQERVGLKKITQERKQEQMNAVADAPENPFDCIFGLPESADEIPHSDTFRKSPSRPVRGHKRSRHRHKKRHQEEADHA